MANAKALRQDKVCCQRGGNFQVLEQCEHSTLETGKCRVCSWQVPSSGGLELQSKAHCEQPWSSS